MSAESPPTEGHPGRSPARLLVLVLVLVVAVFVLWRQREAAREAAGLLGTREILARELNNTPYVGDEQLAAVLSEQLGREVKPESIALMEDYMGALCIGRLWILAKEEDWNAPTITHPKIVSVLATTIPREMDEEGNVVVYPEHSKFRQQFAASALSDVRQSGVAWYWLDQYVNSLGPGESIHFPDLEEETAQEFTSALDAFALVLFDNVSRAHEGGEDEEGQLAWVERLIAGGSGEQEQAEPASDEAAEATADDEENAPDEAAD